MRAKTESLWRSGLAAIVCVGETLAERKAGKTLHRIGAQLAHSLPDGARGDNLVVAYEPVWAIGTGLTPHIEEIAEVHSFIRTELKKRFADGDSIRIQYGGSVKPDNAAQILALPHVNGALVGGASLRAAEFMAIIEAAA